MPCTSCGVESGDYPLCLKCYREQQTKQRSKSVGGSDSSQIPVRSRELKYWADKLYAIAIKGIKYASTDYDAERYDEIKELSRSLYAAHKKAKKNVGHLTEKQLRYILFRLDEITTLGNQYSRNEYDDDRYSEIRLVYIELSELLHTPKKKERPSLKAKSLGSFVSDDDIKPLILELIENAKQELLIASPWITVGEVIDRLIQTRKRNVSVKVLARQVPKGKTAKFSELTRNEVDITADNALHAKMIIADGKRLFLGSPNLSGRSLDDNLEVGILTQDKAIIEEAKTYFLERFWDAKINGLTEDSSF